MSNNGDDSRKRENVLQQADLAIDLLYRTGVRQILLIFGPVPEPSQSDPIRAVIYVQNLAESIDAAETPCN